MYVQVSVIIPCKGRLEHLKQCLPTIEAQTLQPYEVIVVDYDCPDKCYKWVKEQKKPNLKAIKAKTLSKYFNLSRARNEGYRASIGDILFFCDADTLLNPNFLKIHIQAWRQGAFMCGWGMGHSTGNLLVSRVMFEHEKVRGFNEALNNWGGDDITMYLRMENVGFRRIPFFGLTDNISHGDDKRVEHYEVKDKDQSNGENFHIASIKWEGI